MINDLRIYMSERIKNAKKVIIIPHINPDFDAIGSAAGITLIAKKFKKESRIIVDDDINTIDDGVRLIINELNQNNEIVIDMSKYKNIKDKNDLFILTDVNKKHLISVNDIINKNNTIIIDQHEMGDYTVSSIYKFIDPNVSSASEIITRLLTSYKIKIPEDIANYLLAGIHLDTNRLAKNTTSNTFRVVSKLLDSKADMNKV